MEKAQSAANTGLRGMTPKSTGSMQQHSRMTKANTTAVPSEPKEWVTTKNLTRGKLFDPDRTHPKNWGKVLDKSWQKCEIQRYSLCSVNNLTNL